jgi:hypothetical protein
MARTNSQKRRDRLKANAGQQTARRARMARDGMPDTGAIDSALVEALRFAVSTLARDLEHGHVPMLGTKLIGLVTTTATDILVRRQGHDDRHSRRALARRLKRHQAHLDPGHIPSLVPDPALQAARAAQAAAPPLLPQTTSDAIH